MASAERTAAPQQHVLIAVDPSQASRHAASWALRHGLLPAGARIALVSVVPSPPLAPLAPGIAGVGGLTSTAGVAEYEKEWQANKAVHREALTDVQEMLVKGGCVVSPDDCVLLDGDGAGGHRAHRRAADSHEVQVRRGFGGGFDTRHGGSGGRVGGGDVTRGFDGQAGNPLGSCGSSQR